MKNVTVKRDLCDLRGKLMNQGEHPLVASVPGHREIAIVGSDMLPAPSRRIAKEATTSRKHGALLNFHIAARKVPAGFDKKEFVCSVDVNLNPQFLELHTKLRASTKIPTQKKVKAAGVTA